MTAKREGKRRFRWRALIAESLSVLLGVLAAFGVEEWRTNRANRERARVALANITREIEANREHLERVRAANRELEQNAAEADAPTTYSLGWGLQSTAWDVARSTGIVHHLDYDVALSISSLYQFQQTYMDLIHGLAGAQMVAVLTAEGDDMDRIEALIDDRTRLYLGPLAQSEEQLLGWYDRALRFAGGGEAGGGDPPIDDRDGP